MNTNEIDEGKGKGRIIASERAHKAAVQGNLHTLVVACLVSAVLLVVMALCVTVGRSAGVSGIDAVLEPLDQGWTLGESGNGRDVDVPSTFITSESVSISCYFSAGELTDLAFVLDADGNAVEACLNGESFCSVNMDMLAGLTPTYANVIVKVPPQDTGGLITFTFSNSDSSTIDIPEIYMGTRQAAVSSVFIYDGLSAFIIVFAIVVALLLFAFSIFARNAGLPLYQIICIASLFMLTACWCWASSDVAISTLGAASSFSCISHFLLVALPCPFVAMVWDATGRSKGYLRILVTINLYLLAFHFLTLFFGWLSFSSLEALCCLVFVADCAVSLVALVVELRGRAADADSANGADSDNVEQRLMCKVSIASAALFAAGTVMQAVCLFFDVQTMALRNTTLVMFSLANMFPLCAVCRNYMYHLRESRAKQAEAKLLEQITYVDELTGLGNRRAFLEHVEWAAQHEQATLAEFDMVEFGRFSRVYGVDAVQTAVKCVASLLRRHFDSDVHLFRIGTDKFAAVELGECSHGTQCAQAVAAGFAEFGRKKGWPLALAAGLARLASEDEPRRSAHDWKLACDMCLNENAHSVDNPFGVVPNATDKDLDGVISGVINTIELRDGYHVHHTRNVMEIARIIAVAVGLSDANIEEVQITARLHMLGKVGVPDELLHNASLLTQSECAEVAGASVVGERLVATVDSYAGIARAVRGLSEHYDGSGFPDGLARDQIPIAARIVALACAVDAMSCERPWRAALPPEKVLAEVTAEAGKRFDPKLVLAVVENWSKIVFVAGKGDNHEWWQVATGEVIPR